MTPRGTSGSRGSVDPLTRLKNRARREEHRENWTKALELYTEAINVSEKQDSSPIDVSLYNRIGDIHLQLGKREKAVSFYELAIRHYTDQDLHTSAIALCNKVLRILPTRVGIYLHLGRLHAATGLDADARLHYQRFLVEMGKLGHESEAIEALEESVVASHDEPALASLLDWIVETGGGAAECRLKALRSRAELSQVDVQAVDAALARVAGSVSAGPGVEPDSIDEIAAELSDAPVETIEVDPLDGLAAELDDDPLTTFRDERPEESSLREVREFVLESEPPAAVREPSALADGPVVGDLADELADDLAEAAATFEPVNNPISPAVIDPDPVAQIVDPPPDRQRTPLPPPFPVQTEPEPPYCVAVGREEPLRQPEVETFEPPTWRQLARAIVLPPFVPDAAESGDWTPGPEVPAIPTARSTVALEGVVLEPEAAPEPQRLHPAEIREHESEPAPTLSLAPGLPLVPEAVEPNAWALEASTAIDPRGPAMRGFAREAAEPTSALDQLVLPLPSDVFTPERVTGPDGPAPLDLPFELHVESEEQPTNGGPSLTELLSALRGGIGVAELPWVGSPFVSTTGSPTVEFIPPPVDRLEKPLRPNGISPENLGSEALERVPTEAGRGIDVEPSEHASGQDTLIVGVATPPASVDAREVPTHEPADAWQADVTGMREAPEMLTRPERQIRPSGQPVEAVESYVDPFEGQLENGIRLREQGELGRAMEAFGLALASPEALAQAWGLFLECRAELEAQKAASTPAEPVAEPAVESVAVDLEPEPDESAAEPVPEDLVAEPGPEFEAIEGPAEPEPPLEPEANEAAVGPVPELEIETIETAIQEDPEPDAELESEQEPDAQLESEPEPEPAPRPMVAEPEPEPEPVRPVSASMDQAADSFLKFVRTAPASVLPAAFQELEHRGEHAKALLILDRQLETQKDDLELLKKRAQIVGLLGRKTEAVDGYLALAACAENAEDGKTVRWAYEQVLRLEPDNGPALAAINEVDSSETAAISAEVQKEPMIDSRLGSSIRAGIGAASPPLPPQHTVAAPMGAGPEVRPYDGVAGGNDATLDFEKLVSEFRAELAETTVEADTRSRTELGANLKSMGLLDDAIRELQAAIREPEAPPTAYELLGEAFIEKGQARVATRILSRALNEAERSDREMLGVLYQLAVAYETVNEFKLALDCYERVFSVDIDYRDVKDRISACARLA